MTVDSVVNVEEEKCGLDMPPPTVGGCGDCNGDGKDDYVFVNGSDVASDDHGETDGGELNLSELSVDFHEKMEGGASEVNGGDQLEIHHDRQGDELHYVVKINVEAQRCDGKVEGGELVKENKETKTESEVIVQDGQLAVENGGSNNVQGEADVDVGNLEVVEESDARPVGPVLDEMEGGESVVDQKGRNCNVSVDGLASSSIDDDDDDKVRILPSTGSGSDAMPLHEHEVQNGTGIVEVEPLLPDGEFEEQQHLVEHQEHENLAREPEKLEDEVGKSEMVEDNVEPHLDELPATEPEPVDSLVKESMLLEADIRHHSVENDVVETQPSDGDDEARDSEAEELPLDDAITKKQSVDCQQQDLQPDDGESKSLDLIEAETEVRECDNLDLPEVGGNKDLDCVDSEAAGHELQQSGEGEIKGRDASDLVAEVEETHELQTVHKHFDEAENQSNLELTALGVEEPVLESTDRPDESKLDLTENFEESRGTPMVDGQPDTTDKPVVDHELEMVDREGKSELIAEVGGNQKSSAGEDILPDQVAQETGSVDVIDKEVPSENLSLENTVTVEEAPILSKLKYAEEASVDEDGKDLGVNHVDDVVSENEVVGSLVNDSPTVPESGEYLDDSGSSLRSEGDNSSIPVDSLVPDTLKEQGVVDDVSCVADNSFSCSADDTNSQPKSEIKIVNGEADVANKSNCVSEDTLKSKISFGSFECLPPFSRDDNLQTDLLNRSIEFTTSQSNSAGDKSESKDEPGNGVVILDTSANGVYFTEINHDKTCTEVASSEQLNMDEVSASPLDRPGADSSDEQNVNPELVRRPFYYLIRIPRFDDEKLREQIRASEIQVEEKTRNRDAVRVEYQKRKAACRELKSSLEAAKSEERAARQLMMAKKREIDSAQSLVNLARNAMTVEDVDSRILNMERRIQHETLDLTEEKKLIREIKQLNHQREQLSANTRRQQELQQALDQRAQTEEHLKVLRKEMDALRDNHAKAEESVKAARKKYDEESGLLNNLSAEFKSADTIRQEAYAHLQTLRKQWSEKNQHFRNYKDDAKAANDYAMAGKKDSLERHCVNQVERIMELWNKNDEFRKEYISRNMRSTLRRLRTLDGRSLGPDEEPVSLGNVSDDKVHALAKPNSVATVSTIDRDFPMEAEKTEDKSSKKVMEQNNKTALTKKMGENKSKSRLAEPSGRIDEEEVKEHKPTKEEEESARKAEQIRREEEAARLREQRRLEEKAKAQEALDRKRRMAEKAQARAEFRARKEAEEKEKEREKRAKKKEKKRGVPSSETAESEPAQLPESSSETTTEPELTEKPVTVAKKSPKPVLYTKQIKTTKLITPPPATLRNRGKKRVPQFMWFLMAMFIALCIFRLGDVDIAGLTKLLISGPSY